MKPPSIDQTTAFSNRKRLNSTRLTTGQLNSAT